MRKYSKELYDKEVLMKSAFAFTDECYIHLDANESYYVVELQPKDDKQEQALYQRFENELIAQSTRKLVSEKTKRIREMIVSRALASTIIDWDENETDNEKYDSNSILKDWFDDGQ